MNILIAGGSGMIGKALASDLVSHGHSVAVLTRNPDEKQLPEGVKPVVWDGKTAQGWEAQAAWADVIINLAGANIGARPWTNERKWLIRRSRVDTGQAIVSAVRQSDHRPQMVIQISGVNFYGAQNDERLNEQAPAGDDFLASVGQDWEAATAPVREYGVRQVVLRTAAVLSLEEGILPPFILQNQLYVGGPLGSGKQWVSWIHLEDLLRIFNFLLEQPQAEGVYNAAAPEPLTNADFGYTVSRIMHRPFWLPVPGFMLSLILGEMSTLVLEGLRVYPERLLAEGFEFKYPTLGKALEDLLE